MYVIMFKQHGDLNCDQKVFGPFSSHDLAYEALSDGRPELALDPDAEDKNGWRFIQELTPIKPYTF